MVELSSQDLVDFRGSLKKNAKKRIVSKLELCWLQTALIRFRLLCCKQAYQKKHWWSWHLLRAGCWRCKWQSGSLWGPPWFFGWPCHWCKSSSPTGRDRQTTLVGIRSFTNVQRTESHEAVSCVMHTPALVFFFLTGYFQHCLTGGTQRDCCKTDNGRKILQMSTSDRGTEPHALGMSVNTQLQPDCQCKGKQNILSPVNKPEGTREVRAHSVPAHDEPWRS